MHLPADPHPFFAGKGWQKPPAERETIKMRWPAFLKLMRHFLRASRERHDADLARIATEQGRVLEALRHETRSLAILTATGTKIAVEREVPVIVATVTEAAVELGGAAFGAFFYKAQGPDGEDLILHAKAGPMAHMFSTPHTPSITPLFKTTFDGAGVIRSEDISQDPRYGAGLYAGIPPGHPPVRAYMAVPVHSRFGDVIGVVLLGHVLAGVFDGRRESLLCVLATQAAVAMDNANLNAAAAREIEARRDAEDRLRQLNEELEGRVVARTLSLEAEAKQRESAEELLRQSQKMEAIGQLTGGVAHDFNNVLQAVTGNLSLLHRRLSGDGEMDVTRMRRFVENAANACGKAATLTQQLLAFARRQRLQAERLDPVAVLRGDPTSPGMSDLIQSAIGESIAVEWRIAPDAGRCLADKNQLESAVLNLVTNARDAIAEGKGKGTITISISKCALENAGLPDSPQSGDYVRISVKDTGPGMPDEIRVHAFEPFHTTKPVGKGTGLGLAQVYGFARQSGGIATIDSPPGEGAEVAILLPRLRDIIEPLTILPATGYVLRGQGEQIMVVEDDEAVREVVVDQLTDLGYRVIEAENADAALVLLRSLPHPAMILTDMAMPGTMDGMELARLVRSKWPAIPVVLVTGNLDPPRRDRMPEGVVLMHKPYKQEDLTSLMRRMIEGAPTALDLEIG